MKIWNFINNMMSRGGHGWVWFISVCLIFLGIFVPYSFGSKNTVPVILTMDSLGYDTSVTESVDLRTVGNEIDRYELKIANTDLSEDDYQFIRVTLFDTQDPDSAESILQEEMLSVKKSEQEWMSGCKGNCISLNRLKEIDLDEDFFCLDAAEWNADKAYALYDYENYPDKKYYRNYLFLLKQNRTAVLEFSISFEMTSERIMVLKELIDTDVFQ